MKGKTDMSINAVKTKDFVKEIKAAAENEKVVIDFFDEFCKLKKRDSPVKYLHEVFGKAGLEITGVEKDYNLYRISTRAL